MVLDAGTTTLAVARALQGRRNLRVFALSLHIAAVLADEPGLTTMIGGGIIRPGERSLIGALADKPFAELYFDTVVLTVGGVAVAGGVTEYNLDDAAVKRAAFASSRPASRSPTPPSSTARRSRASARSTSSTCSSPTTARRPPCSTTSAPRASKSSSPERTSTWTRTRSWSAPAPAARPSPGCWPARLRARPAARGRAGLRRQGLRRLAGRHARRARRSDVARLGPTSEDIPRPRARLPAREARWRLLGSQRLHGRGRRARRAGTVGPRRARPAGPRPRSSRCSTSSASASACVSSRSTS